MFSTLSGVKTSDPQPEEHEMNHCHFFEIVYDLAFVCVSVFISIFGGVCKCDMS